MWRYFSFLVLLIVASCSGKPSKISDTKLNSSLADAEILVLNYQDFGPPIIAHEIIGNDWWQWQAHGDSRPREYNIKVVVYRNIGLDRVADQFPVVPENDEDYRYLEYSHAINYLLQHISEDLLPVTTEHLQQTKNVLEKHFE